MRLFIDTGSVAEVEEIAAWGVLSGATTNPSLLAKEDGDPGESIKRICDLVGGPTTGEVVYRDVQRKIAKWLQSKRLPSHIGGRVRPEIGDHIINRTPGAAYQLRFGVGRSLKVHPAQGAGQPRHRAASLDEIDHQAVGSELLATKGAGK